MNHLSEEGKRPFKLEKPTAAFHGGSRGLQAPETGSLLHAGLQARNFPRKCSGMGSSRPCAAELYG